MPISSWREVAFYLFWTSWMVVLIYLIATSLGTNLMELSWRNLFTHMTIVGILIGRVWLLIEAIVIWRDLVRSQKRAMERLFKYVGTDDKRQHPV